MRIEIGINNVVLVILFEMVIGVVRVVSIDNGVVGYVSRGKCSIEEFNV